MIPTPALIPMPRKAVFTGDMFTLTPDITVDAMPGTQFEADFLRHRLDSLPKNTVKLTGAVPGRRITLAVDIAESKLGPEGFRMTITEDFIRIVSAAPSGVFYGVQTLLQLIPTATDGKTVQIPCGEIEDTPQSSWRGLMLDVSRYFMPSAFIKKLIDLMAMHKLNVLHLHLTDDQGWRLAIDAFPELAEIGAYRAGTVIGHLSKPAEERQFDTKRHGGIYSKQDIRELVAYASQQHVTVVPEIEMPGHAQAALACYPELSCTGGPFEVSQLWGVHKDVYCAGNEQVFSFLATVLEETLALFPSEFIHIGGDECPKDRWKVCPKCQERIRSEGLSDEHELQSWFIRRIEKFLSARGRRLIGWDEILEGGLAPGATVMSWRSEAGSIASARKGHDAVNSPQKSVYLDYYQAEPSGEPLAIGGLLPLRKAYEFSVVPGELNADEGRHILGTQAMLWTEYMSTAAHIEYMAFPRLCAIAEVAWGTANPEDYDGFLARLAPHLTRLDAMGVNYRPLDGQPQAGR